MYADHRLLGRKYFFLVVLAQIYVPGHCDCPWCLVTSRCDRKNDATGNILTSVYLREEKVLRFWNQKEFDGKLHCSKKIHNYIKYTDFCNWIIKSICYIRNM